jgi:hypothetical protein
MAVAPDYFADIGFAHLDFEDQLPSLLKLCHQYLFWCFHQLPDDKLEKGLHGKLLSRRHNGLFARFQDHARDSGAGLSAMRHPIINSTEVQMKIFTGLTRIVVSDHFNKLSVARTSFVRYHHPIERTVFGSFSP